MRAFLALITCVAATSLTSNSLAQTDVIPTEPDWTSPAAENAPVTLEDDLANPDPVTTAVPFPTPLPDTPLPADVPLALPQPQIESLPLDPFPTSPFPVDPIPNDEPVIEPAPEELDPDFRSSAPPTSRLEEYVAGESPDDVTYGVPSDTGYYLPDLTDPLDPFFQINGLKVRIGEVHLRLPMNLSFQYDDNIFQSNINVTGDFISAFSPTLLLGIGDYALAEENYFRLSFTPQFQFFLENSELNTTNQFLSVTGQYAFPRLTTTGSLIYSLNSNPTSTDQGRQERASYSFLWGNSYALGAKTFLEADLGADYQDDGSDIQYTTVTLSPRIAYQYSPKLRLGFGPVFGVTSISSGGQQTFQGLVLSIGYDTLERFAFRASLGAQARQFDDDSAENEDYVTPTFSLGTSYQIGDDGMRSISLDFSRTIGNSSFVSGQSVINNAISVAYTQPFLYRLSFNLALSYQVNEYQGLQEDTDNFFSARPAITYSFLRDQVALSLFYTRSQRTSEIVNREFTNNVIGLNLNFQF